MIKTRPENSPYPEVQWTAIFVSDSGSCYQEHINRLPFIAHGATEEAAIQALKSQVYDLIAELSKVADA